MKDITTVLAHGLEGSPNGTKAKALRDAGFALICPDCRGLILEQRIKLVEPYIISSESVLLIGSSYGGLVALALAAAHPQHIGGLLLCAPALHHREAPLFELPTLSKNIPTVIIHGQRDELIPFEMSLAYAEKNSHISVEITEDDHRLSQSIPQIVAASSRLYAAIQN